VRRVAITAAGVTAASGSGLDAFAKALAAGVSLAKPVGAFDASRFPVAEACEAPDVDARKLAKSPKDAKVIARGAALALAALKDLTAVALAPWLGDPWEAGLFMGVGLEQGDVRDLAPPVSAAADGARLDVGKVATEGMAAMNPLASLRTLPNMALAHVAIRLGDAAPRGPNAAYSPFDSATLDAVGADSAVTVFAFQTFARLGMLAPSRPLGEAAALFAMEEEARARGAGREPIAIVEGWAGAADGAEIGAASTASAADAMRAAIDAAEARASSVDVVVVSSRDAEPAADERALEALHGFRGARLAPRRVFGESAAGSGAVAIAAGLAAIGAGARRVLVSAAGFGGSYSAIVLGAAGSGRAKPAPADASRTARPA